MNKSDISDDWEYDEDHGNWWHMCDEGDSILWQTKEWRIDAGVIKSLESGGHVVTTTHRIECKGCHVVVSYDEDWEAKAVDVGDVGSRDRVDDVVRSGMD